MSSEARPSVWRLLAFASPVTLNGLLLYPMVAVLPAIFAKNFDISLQEIGSLLFLGRMFDAVTDPLIGHLSDKTRSRFGARKPWVFAAGFLLILPTFLLFSPPAEIDAVALGALILLIYLLLTMLFIPHLAWSAEISRDYDQRTRIASFIAQFSQAGILMFGLVPLLLGTGRGGFTPEVLFVFGVGVAFLAPVVCTLATALGPVGPVIPAPRATLAETLGALRRNRPFHIFAGAYMIGGIGMGMYYSLFYLYTINFLQLGSIFSWSLLTGSVTTILSIPLWRWAAGRMGKHRAWAVANFAGAALFLALATVSPGEGAFATVLTLLIVHNIAAAGLHFLPGALLGDVIDYDTLRNRRNRAGMYFASFLFLTKANAALGGALGFWILGWLGYDPTKPGPEAATSLVVLCFVVPALILMLSSAVMWFFPLHRARQSTIARRLAGRARRAAAAPPD